MHYSPMIAPYTIVTIIITIYFLSVFGSAMFKVLVL